jgi:hypothetical protein
MHGQFDPLGALFLVVWVAVGGFAVSKFFQQPQPTLWHWLSLIVGVLILALGVLVAGLGLYTFWRSH